MFNSISGTLSGRGADYVWISTGGVEWDISVPARAVADFGPEGSQATVFTWLHHYDDGMRLFGFPSARERATFLELTRVEGIGPKQALKILSGISPEALATALDSGDLATLQRIPGVGPKLAQKMMLTLKGRLVEAGGGAAPSARGMAGEWADLVRSLVDMGFDRRSVEAVVKREASGLPAKGDREKELFRRALMELSGGGAI